MAQAVSGVARSRLRAIGWPPWLHVPVIDLPSPLSFPSNVPPIPTIEIFTADPWKVIVLADMGCPP
jgi:hypothetical protein